MTLLVHLDCIVWFYLFIVVSLSLSSAVAQRRVRQGDFSTYYFLVCGDQRAVIALVVFRHIEVLNILYDLRKEDRQANKLTQVPSHP